MHCIGCSQVINLGAREFCALVPAQSLQADASVPGPTAKLPPIRRLARAALEMRAR